MSMSRLPCKPIRAQDHSPQGPVASVAVTIGQYGVFPTRLARDTRLPKSAVRLYLVISGAGCWRTWRALTTGELARLIGVTVRHVRKLLHQLIDYGYLVSRPCRMRGTWWLRAVDWLQDAPLTPPAPATATPTPVIPSSSSPSPTEVSNA